MTGGDRWRSAAGGGIGVKWQSGKLTPDPPRRERPTAPSTWRRLFFREELLERPHQRGVELRAGAGADDGGGLLPGHGAAVGALTRQRVEAVGDGQDARQRRDGVAGEAVGVALAVVALVVAA